MRPGVQGIVLGQGGVGMEGGRWSILVRSDVVVGGGKRPNLFFPVNFSI